MERTRYRHFGDMVKDLRTAANMTQRELAKAAGISQNTVHIIETNKAQSADGTPPRPELQTIDAICAALGGDRSLARMLVYPPNQDGSVVVTGDGAPRMLDSSASVNLRTTIDDLRHQARNFRAVADRLDRTADELEEFGP